MIAADRETALCSYLQAYAEWRGRKVSFALRHPRLSLSAVITAARLQRLTAAPSAGLEGAAIRRALLPRSTFVRTWAPVTAVLPLPECPDDFGLGRPNQTLRRKVRSAERLGIRCGFVEDPAERLALLELATESEREHPMSRYRNADPDNSELPGIPLWMAAYAADGRPLLLAVTPTDGQWAQVRYFRTIGSGDEQSDARYLALYVLARHLTGLGVRYLFDAESLTKLAPGLRHYQQMVGFRAFRIRLRNPARSALAQDPTPRPA